MPTLLGLRTCDTCRKAVKALREAGHSVDFRDVREEPLSDEEIANYLELFAEELLNTRSTTWRNLDEKARKAPPAELLRQHPTLMKRPLIVARDGATLGWTKAVQAKFLG